EAFPNSSFTGYDFHGPSIEQANTHAKAHGLGDRVRFECVTAKDIAERDFDLVTMFDCLHDMGDPRGCAAHVRKLLKPDGSWMRGPRSHGSTRSREREAATASRRRGRAYFPSGAVIPRASFHL